jgi:hypothetical protein
MAEKRKRSYQITHEGITLIDRISRERGWVQDNLKDADKTGIED